MPFTRTNWANYQSPAINALNLNNIEAGIWYALVHSGGVRNTAEFLDRNPGSTTGGLAEAVTDLGGSPGIVFAAPHNHPINGNYTIPANVHLIAGRGATFTIANGITLTINGTMEAGLYQIFSLAGTGKVIITKYQTLYPQWWGAMMDGVIDDVIPIQQMFDALGDTTTIRSGQFAFTGPVAISDTMLLERKSAKLTGLGWGNSLATNPYGHYIKWIGPAGKPMLRLHRSQGCEIQGFRFIGDSTAKPSAAISIFVQVGDGNPGIWTRFERIYIGPMGGFDSDDLEQFDAGILFEGFNANGSANSFRDIRINKIGVGVDIQQTQYVNNHFMNLYVSFASIAGVRSLASLRGANWYFDNCLVNFVLTGDNYVQVDQFSSERAGQLATLNPGSLMIDGGYFMASKAFIEPNGRVIDSFSNTWASVILRNYRFETEAGYWDPVAGPALQIRMKEAPGGDAHKYLKMTQVKGLTAASLDMDCGAALKNLRYIDVETLEPYDPAIHWVARYVLGPNDTVAAPGSQVALFAGGLVAINDNANANMTRGLTINQGASDDEILALKSSDVAHAMTNITETDTFLMIRKESPDQGGPRIVGLRDGQGIYVLNLEGYGFGEETTKTVGGRGVICLFAGKSGGIAPVPLGANGNLVSIHNGPVGGATRFIFDAEGDGYADVQWTTYQDHDDLALIVDMEQELLLRESEAQTDRRHTLEELGIIGKDSWHMESGKPRAMINYIKLLMLHHGGLIQVAERMALYERALIEMGVQPKALISN